MGLACKIRGHRWHKTPDGKDGCCCESCGERNYGGDHDWHKQPGSCVARCTWCGNEREIHDWNRCTCTWCGEVRDFDHKWEWVSGTCDFKCVVCGKVSDDKKSHKWAGCTCSRCGETRNEGHDFAPAPDGNGALICSICGIDSNESYVQAAIEALKKEHSNYWHCDEAKKLIDRVTDPACLLRVAPYAPGWAIRRLAKLGADGQLASIARDTSYGYETRREARNLIRDEELRESIDVQRSEMEAVWYDYDIKSGM